MSRILKIILIAAFTIIATVGCNKSQKNEEVSKTDIFMGTVVKITLYEGGGEDILNKAFDKVKEIEDLVSINKENTELEKLNKSASIEPVKLSDTTFNIIEKALHYSQISDGNYDLTIGPLVKLWNIGLPQAKVPTQSDIDDAIKKVDYTKVEINKDKKEVFLKDKNMMLDLGSIAKGYAADEIIKVLKENGVKEAIVDLGGNLYIMGLKNGESEWKIGIQDPFDDRGNIVGSIEIHDKSVVTSGIYERYIEKDGVKYHHILNPKTGYPYETDIAGISIIANKSIDADALSTLIFTKGIKKGLEFVEDLENVDAIFVSNDKKIYVTSGLKDNFKLSNDKFKVIENN